MKTGGRLTLRAMKSLGVRGLVAFAMALSITGCFVQSLHPLFAEKDPVFELGLLGTWVGEVGREKSTITFQESKDQAYELIYSPTEGEPARLEAHIVRLGKFLFLDTFPAIPPDIRSALYLLYLFPMHQIFSIQLDGDVLRVATLDSTKLDERIANIRHEWSESAGSTLLTAHTDELQEFVLKHAEDAFTEVGQWHRRK